MANILIVEDEKKMQEIIAEYMQRGGHTCFTADDGMDALLALKNHPMDLMILDIMMPHLDGFSVCKMAREMSSLPIMILTAKSDEEDKLKGYEYGAEITLTHKEYELLYFFLSNPEQIFSREQLLNRIWGYDFEGNTRTVDTHIKTLRQKLGSEGKSIVTLIRSGYKFEVAK